MVSLVMDNLPCSLPLIPLPLPLISLIVGKCSLSSQIGTDTMSMKDAMGRLKQQALEFSVKSQKETEAAAAARAAAAAEYDKVAQELAEVKGQVRAG